MIEVEDRITEESQEEINVDNFQECSQCHIFCHTTKAHKFEKLSILVCRECVSS